jgi:type III restriction enzyme
MALIDDINGKFVELPPVPDYITDNLAHNLRPYQTEAISKFLFLENKQEYRHLLWQMATGSGKTLIMAALILEFYKKGYRNFWFFVNTNNIIIKTLDNFLNSNSKKYQFAKKIMIDGNIIPIKKVETFSSTDSKSINIKFSTIHKLHDSIQGLEQENQISKSTFEKTNVIMLADEAHHLNASTKKGKEEEISWENSVQEVLKMNLKNYLLEFTATGGLKNVELAKKYQEKLIYNYALPQFCQEKFSKDVFTHSIDVSEIEKIMLRAVLTSQFRMHIASENGIPLKPIILFKSKGATEKSKGTEVSKDSYEKFNNLIRNLLPEYITEIFNTTDKSADESNILKKTVEYFKNRDINDLISEIKMDFNVSEHKVLLHDGTNKRVENQDKLVNTLEEKDNLVRAIFAVNVLDEGWDVLNLFDIVRLYDTQATGGSQKGKSGMETVAEAQLIGRGARYFPFNYADFDKFKRKFDDNQANPLRAIETMHYHCKHNPQYISDIRNELENQGLINKKDDQTDLLTLTMKENFKNGKIYKDGYIWTNDLHPKKDLLTINVEVVETPHQSLSMLPDYSQENSLEIKIESGESVSQEVFSKTETARIENMKKLSGTLGEYAPKNIISFALNSNKNLTFDKLKTAFPKLKSVSEYIECLSKHKVLIETNGEVLTNKDLLFIAKKVIESVEINVKQEQKRLVVTKHFTPKKINTYFDVKIERRYKKSDSEVGKSQNSTSNTYYVNLQNLDYYVYDDNFGTSEEKSFVKWFNDNFMQTDTLKNNGWSDIFLFRNEKKVKLYSWFQENLGEGFEPDFVLIMQKNKINYVFYIEPKGNQFLDKNGKFKDGKEGWKEEFLLQIENIVTAQQAKMKDTKNWKVIGFPFYNEKNTKTEFEREFRNKI